MASEMIERVADRLKSAMQDSGVVSLVANGPKGEAALQQFFLTLATLSVEALRELPSEPGPRYTAGEYSRRTQEAMVDDALSDLMPVYGSKPVDDGEVG